MKKDIFILLMVLFNSGNSISQNSSVFGYTPVISQTTPLGKKIDWGFFGGTTINPANLNFDGLEYPAADIRLQIGNSLIYRTRHNMAVALGFLYQRNFPFDSRHINEFRPYQQIVFWHQIHRVRVAHRFRLSERFIENKIQKKSILSVLCFNI